MASSFQSALIDLRKIDKVILKIINGEIRKLPLAGNNQIIWHYTSAANAISIIEKSEIWASQVGSLNDASEVKYGIEKISNFINEQYDSLDNDTEVDEILMSMQRAIPINLEDINDIEYYITSLSEAYDDLSQWRAYAGGTGGVALGFIVDNEISETKTLKGVLYDDEKIQSIISKIFESILTEIRVWYSKNLSVVDISSNPTRRAIRRRISTIIDLMAPLLAHIKNNSFRGEREFRMGFSLSSEDTANVRISNRNDHISAHIAMPISIGKNEGNILTLKKILIGPARYQDRSERALNLMMKKLHPENRSEVGIELSKIPYR